MKWHIHFVFSQSWIWSIIHQTIRGRAPYSSASPTTMVSNSALQSLTDVSVFLKWSLNENRIWNPFASVWHASLWLSLNTLTRILTCNQDNEALEKKVWDFPSRNTLLSQLFLCGQLMSVNLFSSPEASDWELQHSLAGFDHTVTEKILTCF